MSQITVEKQATLTGHRDSIFTICPSQYNNIFFSAGADGLVVSWDLKNPDEGQLIAKVPNSIYALYYDVKRDRLIVGHNYDGIHIVNWQKKSETQSLNFTDEAIFDINVAGDDILAGTGNGELVIVDSEKMTVKKKVTESEKSLRSLAVNISIRELAAGYSDNMIRIYDLNNYQLKKQWKAHENSVFCLQYSPDERKLLSAGRDARFKIWDIDNNYELVEPVIGHMFTINHLSFSPDSKHFVTCSMDKTIKVWETASLKLLKVIDKARHAGHSSSVNKVYWSSFKNQVISCSDDRTISVWNLNFNNQ